MRLLTVFMLFFAAPVWAEAYNRPIPQAQSATAEVWFALASITLLVALYVVHRLVMRR